MGTRSDIPQLLSALDVFVLTSRIEANPVSILEAMAVGRPVVAPNVGSISESVIDGVTGYLTEPNLVEPVADRLIELLENPALARSLGTAGQKAVELTGSLDSMVAGYQRLISEIYTLKSDRQQADSVRSNSRSTAADAAYADATVSVDRHQPLGGKRLAIGGNRHSHNGMDARPGASCAKEWQGDE